MERTIDGILNEAKTAEVIARVRVIKNYGALVRAGMEFNVFSETETHYYVQNDRKNLTVELSKTYFEVI